MTGSGDGWAGGRCGAYFVALCLNLAKKLRECEKELDCSVCLHNTSRSSVTTVGSQAFPWQHCLPCPLTLRTPLRAPAISRQFEAFLPLSMIFSDSLFSAPYRRCPLRWWSEQSTPGWSRQLWVCPHRRHRRGQFETACKHHTRAVSWRKRAMRVVLLRGKRRGGGDAHVIVTRER